MTSSADVRLRHEILNVVRRDSITLDHPQHGAVVVRDQRPLKFLKECLDDTTPQEFLDALNGWVFFWLNLERLRRLLEVRLYRKRAETVLHIDTAALLNKHGDVVQLVPYNTGSMHVPYPHAPKRGKSIFVDLDEYPYGRWLAKQKSKEGVVELTIPSSVPDIATFVRRVERWEGGQPTPADDKRPRCLGRRALGSCARGNYAPGGDRSGVRGLACPLESRLRAGDRPFPPHDTKQHQLRVVKITPRPHKVSRLRQKSDLLG